MKKRTIIITVIVMTVLLIFCVFMHCFKWTKGDLTELSKTLLEEIEEDTGIEGEIYLFRWKDRKTCPYFDDERDGRVFGIKHPWNWIIVIAPKDRDLNAESRPTPLLCAIVFPYLKTASVYTFAQCHRLSATNEEHNTTEHRGRFYCVDRETEGRFCCLLTKINKRAVGES